MAYKEHIKTRPEVIAATAVGLLDDELLLPNLFTQVSFDQYKGAKDDTVNIKVPGLLPARQYKFRNDRSEGIEFDQYTETTVPITFTGDRLYSAVQLTDEQNDFDQITVNDLMPIQARAVARGVEYEAARVMESGEYEVTIGGAEKNLYQSLVEARKVLRKFRSQGKYNLVVGTDFEAALLLDPRFTTHVSVGDEAPAVVRSGNIGNWLGFNIFVSDIIAPDVAYAFSDAAFGSVTAAPYIPNSVPFGSTATYNGKSLRWIRDYDARYLVDRSVVDVYYGAKQIKDRGFVVVDEARIKADAKKANNGVKFAEKVLDSEVNVRSLKITLGGASKLGSNSEFNTAVGLKAPKIEAPAAPVAPAAPAPASPGAAA